MDMIPMDNLKDTEVLMESNDYKDRFRAEYYQTKIRYEKLKDLNNRIKVSCYTADIIEPEHDSPLSMLLEQQNIMGDYLSILEERAIIEKIKL